MGALFVLLWLARAVIPSEASAGDLDGSWMQALCHAFEHGLQEGTEWLLPLGPLGCFHTGAYDRDLFFTATIVWECGVKLAIAVLIGASVLRMRGKLERVVYYLLVLFLPISSDAWAFLAVLAATAWLLDRPALERAPLARPIVHIGIVLLAVLALVKFSVLMLSAACLAIILLAVWRTSSAKRALHVLALWAVVQLTVWMLAGQSLSNVLPYLSWSLELAAGYNEAMSLAASPRELAAALVAGVCALLVAVSHAAVRPRDVARTAGSLALVAAFVFAFKAGFTRGDTGHTRIFFVFAAAAPFLLGDSAHAGRATHACLRAGRLACAAAAVCGVWFSQGLGADGAAVLARDAAKRVTSNASALLDLRARRDANDTLREQRRRENDLPRVRAAVGDASIDMVSFRQGLLLLNDLNWNPRFTVQGYCAYTPALLRANADHYRGEHAPEFVLFDLESIDGRLPTMDDNEVLQVLLRDYRALFLERDLLLLRREPRDALQDRLPPVREDLMDRTIRFGERVELPRFEHGCRLLALDVRSTLRGKIGAMLYAAAPVRVELSTDGGSLFVMRIVPGMMESGVILDPFLANLQSWIMWGQGEPMPWITSIRLVTDQPWMYAPDVRMRLIRADDLQPEYAFELGLPTPPGANSPAADDHPAIEPAPARIESERPARTINGRWSILVVHAPSRAWIEVPPGRHRLSGQWGLATAARQRGCTAVASVSVVVAEGESRTTLLEETVDSAREADRDGASFDVTFETRSTAWLWLSTTSPGTEPRCAWTYWKAVRLE